MLTCLLALDGVLDSSLFLTIDVLATANRLLTTAGRAAAFRVQVAGVRRRQVRTGAGYTIVVDRTLRDFPVVPRVVIVPGWNAPDPVELERKLDEPDARQAAAFLRRAHCGGAVVAASCSATFLLAECGLLDDSAATTTWWLAPVFRARYPHIELCADLTLARGDRVLTAGAAFSQVDLVLALVSRFAGPRIARLCIRYLALETHPTQARYMTIDSLAHDSPELRRAEAWIRIHLGEPFTMADVAKAARTSARTLARRLQQATGTTPMRFVQRLRVEQAARLLETTDLSFAEIAHRVGYAEPAALRRVMKRELGEGPRGLRASRTSRRASAP